MCFLSECTVSAEDRYVLYCLIARILVEDSVAQYYKNIDWVIDEIMEV